MRGTRSKALRVELVGVYPALPISALERYVTRYKAPSADGESHVTEHVTYRYPKNHPRAQYRANKAAYKAKV
jgi:hypothetical protein